MNFTFDGVIAKEYGIPEAVLFYNIAFWEKQNRLNEHNYFEGRYWTYNTLKAYQGLFDFMSLATIKRALKNLKEADLILMGNFNNDKFNHTNYYTLSDRGMRIVQNCDIRLAQNEPIESVNLNLSILNKNTDSTDKNITDKNIPPISPLENVDREAMFEQFWKAYPSCKRKVDKQGCKRKFLKIENLEAIFPEIMASLEMWKREWAKERNEYIPLTSKWINQQYWTVKDTRSEIEQKVDEAADKHFGDFLL